MKLINQKIDDLIHPITGLKTTLRDEQLRAAAIERKLKKNRIRNK